MDAIGHGRPLDATFGGAAGGCLVLEALARSITPERVRSVLERTGSQSRRVRRVPASGAVWLVIAMAIFNDLDTPGAWRHLRGTLRSLWSAGAGQKPPSKSALSMARGRLGPRPLRRLFVEAATPLATPETPGAFFHGLRVMAIDGMSMDLPDTPANATAFGYASSHRNGEAVIGGYPRVTLCTLEETGTHAIIECVLRRCKCNEFAAAAALLKRVPPGSLVTWDRLYYSVRLLERAVGLGVHILGRVGSLPVFKEREPLDDGSCLATIGPQRQGLRRQAGKVRVRLIEYTIDDPNRPGHGERHRLVTTLLDHRMHPARELIALYHERWEIEISNDEIKTHQLASLRPTTLRSRTPRGVVQEVYGALIAYNAVRRVMAEAAATVEMNPRRMKFTDSIRLIKEATPHLRAASAEQLPRLYAALIAQIAQSPLPPRALRINPRVVRRKMSNFLAKRPEHRHKHQPVKPFLDTVRMLN